MTEVKVIARGTPNSFVRIRVDAKLQKMVKSHLDSWYAEAARATWKNSAELKRQFGIASIVSADRVVFNIKGNEYRLVVAISYRLQIILVIWLGTHREYDRIDVTEVNYDKRRYCDSSD